MDGNSKQIPEVTFIDVDGAEISESGNISSFLIDIFLIDIT